MSVAQLSALLTPALSFAALTVARDITCEVNTESHDKKEGQKDIIWSKMGVLYWHLDHRVFHFPFPSAMGTCGRPVVCLLLTCLVVFL